VKQPYRQLTIDANYSFDDRTPDNGIPAVDGRIADVPIENFYGEPFGTYNRDGFEISAVLKHDFSDDWSVNSAFRYQTYTPERYSVFFDPPDPETGEITRSTYYAEGDYQRYAANVDLVGKFKTGSIDHKLLFGTEYRQFVEDPAFNAFGAGDPYPSINLFDPVYIDRRFEKTTAFFRDDYLITWGAYIQDQIDLLPNLKFLAGVRYNNYSQNASEQILGEERVEFEQKDTAWTPRFGIVYQPIEPISLYFSYSMFVMNLVRLMGVHILILVRRLLFLELFL
jgi:iron complex outermembrane recepter protein